MPRYLFCAFVAMALLSWISVTAHADNVANCGKGGCEARASRLVAAKQKKVDHANSANEQGNSRTATGRKVRRVATVDKSAEDTEAYGRKLKAAVADYDRQIAEQTACLASARSATCGTPAMQLLETQELPFLTSQRPPADPQAPPRVVLTPREVAYIAFTRLKLNAPKPGIGPPPSINRWKMAAVGYPLWLWGRGATDPGPVSDSVGGLFVSLDGHISKTVFDMGDGTKVTCQGSGRKWGRWVDPGSKSPICGHVYTKPSLPKGKYTVTATTYWSVEWNVTGQTGVIPFVQSSTTTLPVGELQTLVR